MKKFMVLTIMFIIPSVCSLGKEGALDEQLSFIGTYNDHYYFLVTEDIDMAGGGVTNNVFIRTYDMGMNIDKQIQILKKSKIVGRSEEEKFIYTVEKIFLHDGKLILFTSGIWPFVAKTEIFLENIDPITLTFQGNRKVIMEVYSSIFVFHRPKFYFMFSEDGSKFMAFGVPSYSKKKEESYCIVVFDKSFNVLWEKKIDLPYKDKEINFDQPVIRNNGDVYVTCSRFFWAKKDWENQAEDMNNIILLKITDHGNSITEKKIDLGIGVGSNAVLELEGDTIMIAALTYDHYAKAVNGFYFANFDLRTDHLIGQSRRYCMQGEGRVDVTEGFEVTIPKKNPDRGKYFEFKGSTLTADGSRYYYAEYTLDTHQVTTYYDENYLPASTSSNYILTKGDILVMKVDPAGVITWISRIPKNQEISHSYDKLGKNPDYRIFSSYYATDIAGNIAFVVNDNLKNLNAKKGKRYTFTGQKGYVQLISLDQDGKISKTPITKTMIVYPHSCTQLSEHEWLLPMLGAKKTKTMMKIDLKNSVR